MLAKWSQFFRQPWALCLLTCVAAWLMTNFFRSTYGHTNQWNFYLYPGLYVLFLAAATQLKLIGEKNRLRLIITGTVALPFLVGVFERQLGFTSDPWEVVTMSALSGSSLALGLFGQSVKSRRWAILTGVVSSFAILAMDDTLLVRISGLIVSSTILLWLMNRNSSQSEVKTAEKTTYRHTGKSVAFFSVAILFLVFGSYLSGIQGKLSLEWLQISPFSGGSSWDDANARNGVGDGQLLTAATSSADTFGPVDSDIFMESKGLTLFDVVSEQFGEPRKPEGNKAVSLNQTVMKHNHKKDSVGTKTASNTSFSISRVRPKSSANKAASTNALFFIKGTTPVHLPMTVFQKIELGTWSVASPVKTDESIFDETKQYKPKLARNATTNKPWMIARSRGLSTEPVTWSPHQIQINTFKTLQFPTPHFLEQFCIDKVDRPEFFRISSLGNPLLRNGCPHIPRLSVLHTLCSQVNLFSILNYPEETQKRLRQNAEAYCLELEIFESSQQIDKAAAEWTCDCETDWHKVQQIAANLRTKYQLDRENTFPDCQNSEVTEFLEAGRGPDYLFATTACLLCRKHHIPCRLVSGFYASPERLDRDTGQVAILSEDIHFWVQVCVDGETWIPVETCPGYAQPRYHLTFFQYCQLSFWDLINWSINHPLSVACILFTLALIYVLKKRIFDSVRSWIYVLQILLLEKNPLLATAKLVEGRAKLAGINRPQSMTRTEFLKLISNQIAIDSQSEIRRFCEHLNHSLFSKTITGGTLSSESIPAIRWMMFHKLSYGAIKKLVQSKQLILPLNSAASTQQERRSL